MIYTFYTLPAPVLFPKFYPHGNSRAWILVNCFQILYIIKKYLFKKYFSIIINSIKLCVQKREKNSLTIYSGLKDTLIRLTTNDRNWIYTTRNMTFSWFIELGAVFLFSLTYLGIEKKWMKLLSSMSVFVCVDKLK